MLEQAGQLDLTTCCMSANTIGLLRSELCVWKETHTHKHTNLAHISSELNWMSKPPKTGNKNCSLYLRHRAKWHVIYNSRAGPSMRTTYDCLRQQIFLGGEVWYYLSINLLSRTSFSFHNLNWKERDGQEGMWRKGKCWELQHWKHQHWKVRQHCR